MGERGLCTVGEVKLTKCAEGVSPHETVLGLLTGAYASLGSHGDWETGALPSGVGWNKQ